MAVLFDSCILYYAYGIMVQMARTKTKPRPRTYARNRAQAVSRRNRQAFAEADGTYFLKLVGVVILSTLWIKFGTALSWNGLMITAFPLGALIAVIAIRMFEKNPFDRKIWFAVLVVVTIVSYFVPAGIVI